MSVWENKSHKDTPNYVQHFLARIFAGIVAALNFLGKTAWPIIDLAFRVWMANQLLVAGVLMIHSWDTSVLLATNEYPIPWLNPNTEALFGILIEIIGGMCLLFGCLTRFGALLVLILGASTQSYYLTLDTNLFWITLMLGYVLRGPGPLSLDYLLGPGVARSPIPFATSMAHFFNKTRSMFSAFYLLILRVWIGITLWMVSDHTLFATSTWSMLSAWFPLHSATVIFSSWVFLLCLFFICGFMTRIIAILGLILTIFAYSSLMPIIDPTYWLMAMALFFVFGPGLFSLDDFIFILLKRSYPQLSGKPAFNLKNLPHVVVIGAGFGGIACAQALRHTPVKVSLIDRHNYHLFQPLLYQVATGSLSPGDIAIPIRSIFADQFNAHVLLGEVQAIDKENHRIIADDLQIPYDYLVIATGATHSYFGKDVWAPFAPGLKQIEDATSVRSKLVETFELAEVADNEVERKRLLHFVIVGGGPTGVELAGAIAELARYGMEKDFRHFDPASAKIILVQAAPRILPTFSESISADAKRSLENMGVKILLNSKVEQIDDEGVIVNGERIYSKSVLWAAGVTASPAAKWLDVEADPAGRVKVTEDLSVPNFPDIFVIGDTALSMGWAGKPVPGLAPAAKQGGHYVAKMITQRVYKKSKAHIFKYHHLGSLATIGRKSAVAEFNRVKIHGAPAWWLWGFIHVSFLVGARNRLSVIVNWAWSYFTFRANNLLITTYSIDKNKKSQSSEPDVKPEKI